MMTFLLERISKLVKDLDTLRYPQSVAVEDIRFVKTTEKFSDVATLDTSDWQSYQKDRVWGGHDEFFWFAMTVTVPQTFQGKQVVFDLLTGREAEWDAVNPQFSVYVNGELRQGFDTNHRELVLVEQAVGGEQFDIVLSAFTGIQNFHLYLDARLRVLDAATEDYYYDVVVPYEVALLLDKDDIAYIEIITALTESLNLLDLRKPYSQSYYDTLTEASAQLKTDFYDNRCGSAEATTYCVGHTHIDVAWLWTLAVTEDKAVRSFSTVLQLMDRYPEYIFMSSQPQLYAYVKKNAPEIYEKIKQRVAEGRWEVNGGMWVEADCNLASGESLVRQCTHGRRFFQEEFQKENDTLWLPDVFGYSAALPQIMKLCGMPYFMTTKISWNETNQMPYDTFEWEGIDGTKVLTHFICSRDYKSTLEVGDFKTDHFTTYNGIINPSEIKGGWKRYQQKHLSDGILQAYGYGDGGGGPTKEMLEYQRRLSKGVPGCPKTKQSTVTDFFKELETQVKGNRYVPTWSGELYLEYHRGTYTSMARNKKYNRQSEYALQNLELFATLDQQLLQGTYPKERINAQWEVLLRNQFHDILPGSSIKEVYDDSKVEYEALLGEVGQLSADKKAGLVAEIDAKKGNVVVFNPNGHPMTAVVTVAMADNHVTLYDGNTPLPTQVDTDGNVLFLATKVPAKGYKTFVVQQEVQAVGVCQVTEREIDTPFYRISLNEKGQFTSLWDKRADRQLLKAGEVGNRLRSYEDKPHNYDAWDINNYYLEKSWDIDEVTSMKVLEQGAVQGSLQIHYRYLDSTVVQTITVYADNPRIDIRHEIDWKEKQILVKALFPVDIHTNKATFDIQYGNVERPTHYNTSWDAARFEVCYHKWLDLSEADYGVSFLNDCKYGASVHDGMVGLSLLKSAIHPNPQADQEQHEFTISLLPHLGDWRTAGTVSSAYQLNNPLQAVVKPNDGGRLPSCYSMVSTDHDNVIVEVVKEAEDENGMIIRLYECHNSRTQTTLTFERAVKQAWLCDLLEQPIKTVETAQNTLSITVKPYEIQTYRIVFEA